MFHRQVPSSTRARQNPGLSVFVARSHLGSFRIFQPLELSSAIHWSAGVLNRSQHHRRKTPQARTPEDRYFSLVLQVLDGVDAPTQTIF